MRSPRSLSSVVVSAAGLLFGTRAARCCFLALGALCTACPVDDAVEGCGDGFIAGDEECDDGNVVSGDGCDAVCLIEAGFECVGTNCSVTVCGDGIIAGSEQCDDGTANGSTGGCNLDCTLGAYCGNAVKDVGEVCDDGNNVDGDGCSSNCLLEVGFACVDGNCTFTVCGDGIIAGTEECDDGAVNGPAYGGCGYDCTLGPYCGDGVIDGGIEECDDGVNTGGPGQCAPGCTIQSL